MHPQIRKRCNTTAVVHKYIGMSDGDKSFEDPIEVKGYYVSKSGELTTRDQIVRTYQSIFYIPGDKPILINEEDEIELPFVGRVPVLRVGAYPSLKTDLNPPELLEVFL